MEGSWYLRHHNFQGRKKFGETLFRISKNWACYRDLDNFPGDDGYFLCWPFSLDLFDEND
jgi:hypothetical protein